MHLGLNLTDLFPHNQRQLGHTCLLLKNRSSGGSDLESGVWIRPNTLEVFKFTLPNVNRCSP